MSDTIVVMNQGYIQQIGTPEDIYNEPENAFVADFIGESNILPAVMVEDKLVKILGVNFPCVDVGFGKNKPVDAVIRPEDIDLVKPEEGLLEGVVTHLIFKGVHYEMEVSANNFDWLVHRTDMVPVGTTVGIKVDPFDIQIMKKPESEDEEAGPVEEEKITCRTVLILVGIFYHHPASDDLLLWADRSGWCLYLCKPCKDYNTGELKSARTCASFVSDQYFNLPCHGISTGDDPRLHECQPDKLYCIDLHPSDVDEFFAPHARMADFIRKEWCDQQYSVVFPPAAACDHQHTLCDHSWYGL